MLRWLAVGAAAALLAACGQKGALRLPDEPAQAVPAPASAPAAGEEEDSTRPRQ